MMLANERIKIIYPKPYQKVETTFIISGWVPISWLNTDIGITNRLFLDFIDINGKTFLGTSIDIVSSKNWFEKFRKRLKFFGKFQFSQFNAPFIIESQGRITIKISGQKKEQRKYIPIIVINSNPNFVPDPQIVNKHKKVESMIDQYEKDLENYKNEMEKIRQRRRQKSGIEHEDETKYQYINNWDIIGGIIELYDQSVEEPNNNYPFASEDLEEGQLDEKYKDALEWRGPLLTGLVGINNGFEFRVFSNDHDMHFHIIHRGRGINARFSFPGLTLINYKQTKTSIRSKEHDELIDFLKKPEIFQKLQSEFTKRKNINL